MVAVYAKKNSLVDDRPRQLRKIEALLNHLVSLVEEDVLTAPGQCSMLIDLPELIRS